jgi:hypothetical protein
MQMSYWLHYDRFAPEERRQNETWESNRRSSSYLFTLFAEVDQLICLVDHNQLRSQDNHFTGK